MNRIVLLLGLTLLGFTLQTCQQKQQDKEATDSTTAVVAIPAETPISEQLIPLGLTQQGHWRGISLGDSITKVKATEKAQLFENEPNHLGYTVEFPSLESMDVLYYQNGKQVVSTIGIDLYLNTQQSVDKYIKGLTDYFTSRYGKSTLEQKTQVWTGQKQEKISLKNVSKGKDFGVQIKIMTSDE